MSDVGSENCAAVASPPSPLVPAVPLPANATMHQSVGAAADGDGDGVTEGDAPTDRVAVGEGDGVVDAVSVTDELDVMLGERLAVAVADCAHAARGAPANSAAVTARAAAAAARGAAM